MEHQSMCHTTGYGFHVNMHGAPVYERMDWWGTSVWAHGFMRKQCISTWIYGAPVYEYMDLWGTGVWAHGFMGHRCTSTWIYEELVYEYVDLWGTGVWAHGYMRNQCMGRSGWMYTHRQHTQHLSPSWYCALPWLPPLKAWSTIAAPSPQSRGEGEEGEGEGEMVENEMVEEEGRVRWGGWNGGEMVEDEMVGGEGEMGAE